MITSRSAEGEGEKGFGKVHGNANRSPAPAQKLVKSETLVNQLRQVLRSRHYSRSTEETYCHWVRRFMAFHNKRHPSRLGDAEVNAFLSHLALRARVSASTQNQALSAILFLYRSVLKRKIGNLGDLVRARRPKRLPIVMTKQEARAVLGRLEGKIWIMACLMYGAGLRLSECLRFRVQDVDFGSNQIIIRDGKGAKDRITLLPESVKRPLMDHLREAKAVHEGDLADGYGTVQMPYALARKYPNAACEWRWQYVFP